MHLLMCDHAAWQHTADNTAYRAVRHGHNVWLITWRPDELPNPSLLSGVSGPAPAVDVYVAPPGGHYLPSTLASALVQLGPVGRVANPDLWDALGYSIIRQVIRAEHARKMYAAFCTAFGTRLDTPYGPTYLFPSPATVEALDVRDFAEVGARFKAPALRAAAIAYQQHHHKWTELSPDDLVRELQMVHRIGPWSAGATVADYRHSWDLYPYADLAVRTWAKTAAPGTEWPSKEPEFARTWKAITGEYLSVLTLLTLAWGIRHGSTG